MFKTIDRTGETAINSQGQRMVIIKYIKAIDIIVRFEDGTIKKTRYSQFKNGNVKNPNCKYTKPVKNRIGETAISTEGQLMTIVMYNRATNMTVQFEDGTLKKTTYSQFKDGTVKNPNCHINETLVNIEGQQMTIIKYVNARDIIVQFENGGLKNTTYVQFKQGTVRNSKSKRIGETQINSKGYTMKITEYKNSHDITVMFEDGDTTNTSYYYFKTGKVQHPKDKVKPGDTRITTCGLLATILDKKSAYDFNIQFEDGVIIHCTNIHKFNIGQISHPAFGKGYYRTRGTLFGLQISGIAFSRFLSSEDKFPTTFYNYKCPYCKEKGIANVNQLHKHAEKCNLTMKEVI